jgi:predicted membrane protein
MSSKIKNPRIWIGLFLVLIGLLFLAENLDFLRFEIPYQLLRWQFIIIVIGIIILLSSDNKLGGIILIAIGVFTLYPDFWPLILIGIGVYLIYKKSSPEIKRTKSSGSDESEPKAQAGDSIDDVSILGGGKKTYATENFRGGKITAIMGGSDIDLRQCKMASGPQYIEVTAIMGGTSIYVPKEWHVVLDVTPILGGFDDERIDQPTTPKEPDNTVIITGAVIMGGGDIKN